MPRCFLRFALWILSRHQFMQTAISIIANNSYVGRVTVLETCACALAEIATLQAHIMAMLLKAKYYHDSILNVWYIAFDIDSRCCIYCTLHKKPDCLKLPLYTKKLLILADTAWPMNSKANVGFSKISWLVSACNFATPRLGHTQPVA